MCAPLYSSLADSFCLDFYQPTTGLITPPVITYALGTDFAWACHLRGITVFPWARAFNPWETDEESICRSFISGFDGLTSDWINKLGDQPIDLIATDPDSAELLYRNSDRKLCENLQRLHLDTNTAIPYCEGTLPNNTVYRLIGLTTY